MKLLQKIQISCAVGLLVSFFLPWGKLYYFSASGYDLATNLGGANFFGFKVDLGNGVNFAWLIPLSSLVVIAFVFYEHSTNTDNYGNISSIIAGALPFIGLIYGLNKVGGDIFEVLAIGVYLSLIFGLILVLSGFGIFNSLSSD